MRSIFRYVITGFYSLIFLSICTQFGLVAQTLEGSNDTLAVATVRERCQIAVKKANVPMKLDGVLSEVAWQNAQKVGNFWQSRPDDKNSALSATEVMLTYDEQNLYIGAVCYDTLAGSYVVQSLRRDYSFPITDAFAVFIDPFQNETTGFSFSVNPYGSQREGIVGYGGQFGVTTSWDNRWFSRVKNYDDRWVVEMAIPFKTLRYDNVNDTWNINFARNDQKQIETSAWCPVPTQYNIATLSFTGQLKWDTPPQKQGGNIALIPYVRTSTSRNFQGEDTNAQIDRPEAGLDAKIAFTSSLNLDVTVNPDFSQVEVDVQVTNLDRFNLFFPERRTFFIENNDLFRFGNSDTQPFFSRRIGLNVPIIAGARLTGNLNENWRIGAMSMQTEGVSNGVQSQNYSVLTFQRKLWQRSNITTFVLSRQAFNDRGADTDDFNRVLGAEFNFSSADNKWQSQVQYHQSFTRYDEQEFNNTLADAHSFIINGSHDSRHWFANLSVEQMGSDFRSDMGFLRLLFQRNDAQGSSEAVSYWHSAQGLGYRFYPKKAKFIRFYGPSFSGRLFAYPSFNQLERQTRFTFTLNFKNNSDAIFRATNYSTPLLFPTDLTGNLQNLLPEAIYNYNDVSMQYRSSKRHRLFGSARLTYGKLFNANRFSLDGDISYRLQPYAIIAFNTSYNDLRFPALYGNSQVNLFGSRLEITFTKNIFLTTFLQYNTQAENFNINTRFQWRFAPMSDVFVVFTDNMNTVDFSQKNWGLILKLNYWLAF